MAKFCSNCGKEIDENADVCLNCGASLNKNNVKVNNNTGGKKKGLPIWAIVLIVVGAVLVSSVVLVAVITFGEMRDVVDRAKEEVRDNFDFDSGVLTGDIGDSLRGDDFNVTLMDASIYESLGDGDTLYEPSAGNVFLVVFFKIKNISDDEVKHISPSFASGYADSEFVLTDDLYEYDIEGVKSLDLSLKPRESGEGYVIFEVSKEWRKFEVNFKDFYDDDDMFIFTIYQNDIR